MTEQQRKNKIKYIIIVVVILIIADQTVKLFALNIQENKIILDHILQIVILENKGGAFGVGQNGTGTFIITNIIVLGTILRFISMQLDKMDNKTIIMLCLILAGGFSNLIDRIFRGFVVDFINIFPNLNLPIFNFADVYIVVGWIILAAIFAIYTYKEIKENKKSATKLLNDKKE